MKNLALFLSVSWAFEIDKNLTSVPPLSQWVVLFDYAVEKSNVEIDVELEVRREGLVGSWLDIFSILLPSLTELSIVSGNSTVLHEKFQGPIISLSVPISVESNSIQMRMKNLNTFFSVSPNISGEIVTQQFDLRAQFPSCPFPIYSQQLCGACYADVVAGAGTDDLCISNKGKKMIDRLSPQPIISCSHLGGCGGGSPYLAALWAQSNGLTKYEDSPFVSGQCSPSDDVERDGCVTCESVLSSFTNEVYRFRPVVLAPNSELAIRKHIEQKGSVMVIFNAHANFQSFFAISPFAVYKSHQDSPSLGNHAVRLVGFGVKDDLKYWIALNSWGSGWANRGSFKILRGSNLCDIELYPVGIESVDSPLAGFANQGSNHPKAGEWKPQDPHTSFWKEFVEKYKRKISHLVGTDELNVSSIQTRVGDGFFVKLKFDEIFEKKVIVHISSQGDAVVSIEHRKHRVLYPEQKDDVSLT